MIGRTQDVGSVSHFSELVGNQPRITAKMTMSRIEDTKVGVAMPRTDTKVAA